MDEPHSVLDRRLFVLADRVERALEVVEDRQELLHQALVRMRDVLLALARCTLLVIVEVGCDTQQAVFELRHGGVNSGVRPLRGLTPVLELRLHQEVFASSSTTSYSPSSTTSSSGVVAPLPPADACACAVAWA